jgi:hypothetical protein
MLTKLNIKIGDLVRSLGEFFPAPKKAGGLSELFRRKSGKPAAKWQSYLQHYDRHFSSIKGKQVCLLEIGVQAGGSLEVWGGYFKSAKHIIGCDINPACASLSYTDPRIQVVIGDVNSSETLESLAAISGTLDVIIDDGSHNSSDIIQSFIQLFPRLTDGGIYLIEDLHCSYWETYQGGLYDPFSAISFFKKIVDIINRPFWGVDIKANDFLAEFKSIPGILESNETWDFLSDIYSVEFVNSMCIIHKRSRTDNALGSLILSGHVKNDDSETMAELKSQGYVAGEIAIPDQSAKLYSDAPLRKNEDHLFKARNEITVLKQQNTLLSAQVYEVTKKYYDSSVAVNKLTTDFYEATKKYYDASVKIQQLEHQINQLEQSTINPDKNSSI